MRKHKKKARGQKMKPFTALCIRLLPQMIGSELHRMRDKEGKKEDLIIMGIYKARQK